LLGSVAWNWATAAGLDCVALPGSEAFYRRLEMMDLDADPDKDDLVYFEYNALP